jgi:hypothetical protein
VKSDLLSVQVLPPPAKSISVTWGSVELGFVGRVCFRGLGAHWERTHPKRRESQMCSTTDDWIKKMWYLYTMEFYSATKKNEVLSFASKWKELENIILRS